MITCLSEYEKRFQKQIENIKILSDIEICRSELNDITSQIKNTVKYEGQYLDKFGLTVSLFLVWTGVYDYKDGNYWDCIDEKLSSNIKEHYELGKIFLHTLKKYDLPTFYDKKSKKYVTPILAHGYVPVHYLNNFFENFIYKFYKNELKFDLNKDKIKNELERNRAEHLKYQSLDHKNENIINEIRSNRKKCEELKTILSKKNIIHDISVLHLNQILSDEMSELLRLPENYLTKLESENNILEQSQRKQEVLHSIFERLNILINNYDKIQIEKEKLFSEKENKNTPLNEGIINKFSFAKDTWASIERLIQSKKETNDIKLKEINENIESNKRKIAPYKMNLKSIGGGSEKLGLNKLNYQRNINSRIKICKEKINIHDNELNKCLENPTNYFFQLEQKKENLEKDIKMLKTQQSRLEEELEGIKDKLYYLPESTKHLVLMGKDIAYHFIYENLKYLDCLEKERIKNYDGDLSERIQRHMSNWWRKKQDELDEGKRTSRRKKGQQQSQYMKEPEIFFDLDNLQIKVKIPEQKFSSMQEQPDSTAKFKIYYDNGLREDNELKVYKESEKRLKTKENIYLLENPSQKYHFEFIYENEVLKEKEYENHDYLIFDENGKLLDENKIEINVFGVLYHSKYKISYSTILKNEGLFGNWADYRYAQVLLEEKDVLEIKQRQNGKLVRRICKKSNKEPYLSSNKLLKSAKIEGKDIYTETVPPLNVIVQEIKDFEFLKLIISVNNSNHISFVLADRQDIINQLDNIYRINLSNILEDRYGFYKIIFEDIRNKKQKHEFCFFLLPSFEINFYKDYYYNESEGNVLITSEKNFVVEKISEFEIFEDNGEYNLRFQLPAEILKTAVQYGDNLKFDVDIYIPVVKWKIGENNYNFHPLEIWHEDFFTDIHQNNLILYLPMNLPDHVSLSLNSDEQTSSSFKINNGNFIFDLSKFSTTIKSNKLNTFYLKFLNRDDLHPIELFSIRTKWEVININIIQTLVNEDLFIDIEWEEKGNPTNKYLKIWKKEKNTEKPKLMEKIKLEKEQKTTILKYNIKTIKSGEYRIHFDGEANQIWGATDKYPEDIIENYKDILIGVREEIIKNILKSGIKVISIEDIKSRFKNIPLYIKNIKKVSSFEHEEKYEGYGYYLSQNQRVSIKTNPLYFYINTKENYLPFLIDIDGDGAEYCEKCKEIFWEIRNQHKEFHYSPNDELGNAKFLFEIIE